MDPNAAVKRWRRALADRDYDEAKEALSDLKGWIRRGGAAPTIKLMPHEAIAIGLGARKKGNPKKRGKRRAKGNPCNPCAGIANPNFHYPKTTRGRPKKPRAFTLEFFGGPTGDSSLGKRRLRVSRQEAHAAATGYVGKKSRGKTIQKVILTGPK